MAAKRLYILKTVDDEEFGPVDQETLTRWGETGRVTAYCQIRSTLIARWEYAKDVAFLKEIIAAQEEERVEDVAPSLLQRFRRRLTLRASKNVAHSGLHHAKPTEYDAAPAPTRYFSGVVDLLAILVIGAIIYLGLAACYSAGVLDATAAFYAWVALTYIGAVMYLCWFICFRTQTFGHKWWGTMLIRQDGQDLYLGRTFIYAVVTMFFGFTTFGFMFVLPSGLALQDIVSGTKMVKTKLIGKAVR